MKQAGLALKIGVSQAYVLMVLSSKKKSSKRTSAKLNEINFTVNSGYTERT